MRGLSLACLVLIVGLVAAAPQEEGVTAVDVTTVKLELEPFTTTVASAEPAVATEAPTEAPTAAPTTTTIAPTVILKQINEINEDGTYTVGYEAADGSFKLETKDEEGNVKGKYGYLDEFGDLKIVEYGANNATGFTNDIGQSAGSTSPVQTAAFELEKERHAAVLRFQASVVQKQQDEAARRADQVRRRDFANQRNQGQRRPVFNAANFNPNQAIDQQFDTRGFSQDFAQQQQQQQFAPQQQQQQQFAPQQQQQQQQQFSTNFQNFNPQQFVEQRRQQFAPQQQQQQFAQQPQQFAQQPQRFAPQQPQQFAPQQRQQFEQPRSQAAPRAPAPTPAPLIPVSELTEEHIRLHGFSRDENQDGQIDALPAHLAHLAEPELPAARPLAPQQQRFAPQQQRFAPQQQQFAPQQQQFAPRQPQFRQPAPVGPGAPQQAAPQLSQQQLDQFFAQAQQQQRFAPQQQQQFAPQQQQRFAPQQQQQFQFQQQQA